MKTPTLNPPSSRKHKEYSIIYTLLALLILFYYQDAKSIGTIIVLNILAVISMVKNLFNIIRHANILCYRLNAPQGILIMSIAFALFSTSLILSATAIFTPSNFILRDTLYYIFILLMTAVIGIVLLFAYQKFLIKHVNLSCIKKYLISISAAVVIFLILPIANENDEFSSYQIAILALIALLLYFVFLYIQTYSIGKVFHYEEREKESYDNVLSPQSTLWHCNWLILNLFIGIAITKFFVTPFHLLVYHFAIPDNLIGFVLALVVVFPLAVKSIVTMRHNHIQRAIDVLFSATLSLFTLTALLTIVTLSILGQPFTLLLSPTHSIIAACALLLCHISFSTGRTYAICGVAHITLFLAFMITF